MVLATVLFLAVYAIIISEKIDRTIATLAGAAIFLMGGYISQEQAILAIDFNTVGLLVGMMVIVGILHHTGSFEFMAIKAAKFSQGEPWKMLILFSIITGVGSAFLDNVTTVLLIVPVTLAITDLLELDAIPFLMAEILVSNIGGTATLIGDPPNIMIGSAVGLTFSDFLIHLTPIVVIIFVITMICLKMIYRKSFYIRSEMRLKLKDMDENKELKNKKLAIKGFSVLMITIVGFLLHPVFHLDSATVAMCGAALLLLISGVDIDEAFAAVEWSVIFFFVGLFIMVGALQQVGVIDFLAERAVDWTGGSIIILFFAVMWISGIGSAFFNNIPFVVMAIPLLQSMQNQMGCDANAFRAIWWALALGACLGGNGTILGANATVVAVDLAAKDGVKITYGRYFKVAFPLMIMSLVLSSVYVYVRYIVFN